jgi:hypothetical protein
MRFENANPVAIVVFATVLATNMTPRHAVIWGKSEGMEGIESIDIVATNAATIATNAVVLSIATEKASYSIHEPVNLNVSLKKFGLGHIFAYRGVGLIYFKDLYVISPNDMRAKETEYARQLELRSVFSVPIVYLAGGEEYKDSLEINRLFDMTLSGYYKIFVRKEVKLTAPECDCKMMLQTPAITIRIEDNAANASQPKK